MWQCGTYLEEEFGRLTATQFDSMAVSGLWSGSDGELRQVQPQVGRDQGLAANGGVLTGPAVVP